MLGRRRPSDPARRPPEPRAVAVVDIHGTSGRRYDAVVPRLQRKSFSKPDQVRKYPHGRIEVVNLDETAVGRFRHEPGWRWSVDVAPIVGGTWCQLCHVGYVVNGRLHVITEDGTTLEIGPGEAYEIPPGHDAWVVGDEPWKSIEFASAHNYGVPPEALGERILATILFSDIVGSTATLERLGDHAWAKLVQQHNMRIRAAIDRHRGREIDSAGDGFLALFDGAARAVHAATL